jgi:MFS family permease
MATGSTPAPTVVSPTSPCGPGDVPRAAPWAARVLPARVFYGWWVVVGCGVVLFVAVGVGFYVLPVFLQPLQDEHGWSNGQVSVPTGLYFSFSGVTSAVVGPLVDRYGPKPFLLSGAVLLGASLAAVGLVEELWQLYVVYLVMAMAFSMASNIGVSAILTRWWVHRRARAMSIAFSFISLGGALFAPLGTALVERGGISLAATVLGVIVVVVAVPVVALVLVWDPAQMGMLPDDGYQPPPSQRHVIDTKLQYRRWTRAQAARTVPFWAILVGFMLVMVAQVGFLAHQAAFLGERFDSTGIGAAAIATAAVGSALARLVVGSFADRADKGNLAVGLVALQALSVYVLVVNEVLAVNILAVLVFGFTMGNIFMMQSLMVGEIYGILSFGTIFGLSGAASQIAGGTGPVLVGWLEGKGGYELPLAVTATMTLVAAAVLVLARVPVTRPEPDAP